MKPFLNLADERTLLLLVSTEWDINVESARRCIIPQTFEIVLLVLLEERCVRMLFGLLVRGFLRQVVGVLADCLRLSLGEVRPQHLLRLHLRRRLPATLHHGKGSSGLRERLVRGLAAELSTTTPNLHWRHTLSGAHRHARLHVRSQVALIGVAVHLLL